MQAASLSCQKRGDCNRRSEQLIDLYWDDVQTVATALLEHGRLDRAEVLRVISPGALSTR